MIQRKKQIAVYLDGNYVFHQAKAAGITQDFARIERKLAERFDASVLHKRFYTRPPRDTNSGPVLGWLSAHGWQTTWLHYDHTHQDSLYVYLVSDVMADLAENEDLEVVIVSGSGALTYPVSRMGTIPHIFTTEESGNKRLLESEFVNLHPLSEIL